ncbi:MAG TPA: hypothetical protein VEW03_12515 [Longimicrobiaceae bacterium]|nr:hypothetical protein [Longimicrobiaceae bacterium]
MHWLYDLPLLVLSLGFVLGCALLGIGGVLLARRSGWTVSPEDNGTAAALHAFVGVVYAVALGLMVVSVQEDYGDVEQAVVTEANAAGDLFRSMEALEPPARSRLQAMLARYVSLVVTEEWPASRHGRRSDTTWRAIDQLARAIDTFQPATPAEERMLPDLVTDSDALLDARRMRLFLGQQGIGAVTWLVIVVGGIVTLGFACCFYMERPRTQLLLTGLMGGMLGLMLFLVVAMDHPLWGRLSVKPDAFLELRTNFEHMRRERGDPAFGAAAAAPDPRLLAAPADSPRQRDP